MLQGASESDGDSDGNQEDRPSRHIGLRLGESVGGSQHSFAALSHQFETAVDSDDGDDSDDSDELLTGVQQSITS